LHIKALLSGGFDTSVFAKARRSMLTALLNVFLLHWSLLRETVQLALQSERTSSE